MHSDFSPMYWCIRNAVATRNPEIMANARAKLYLLRGEQLAREVDARRLASLDAKVLWQELFVTLKAANDQEMNAAAESMTRRLDAIRAAYQPPVPQVPQLTPVRAPTTVTCTTQPNLVGTALQTTCHQP